VLLGADVLRHHGDVADRRGLVAAHERTEGEPAHALVRVEPAGVRLEICPRVRAAVRAVDDAEPLGPPHPLVGIDVRMRGEHRRVRHHTQELAAGHRAGR
jgi:hypothetical protein